MDAIEIEPNSGLYHFDRIFQPDSTQELVYDEVKPFVQIALDGDNVCIFAYGQTGSGKTYTMEGPPKVRISSSRNDLCGIIPRCGVFIFEEVER